MPVGKGTADFTLETGAPVESIRCLAGPTRPRPSPMFSDGDFVWRLVNHLTLNYLSLVDNDERQGRDGTPRPAQALWRRGRRADPQADRRRPQRRFANDHAADSHRRADHLWPRPGDHVTCDEAAFEGTGIFLLGAVLEQFFARYASINSFTETVLSSVDRGEVMRWPARIGRRQIA